MTADQIIRLLDLKPHPTEGGYFRETYRSPVRVESALLGPGQGSERAASTAIFYLLTPDTFSAIHRLSIDEVFHFYLGDPVEMLLLAPDGTGQAVILGPDILAGQSIQRVVPAGVWQGSSLIAGGQFALMGTTMAPGFDFADYQGGEREALIQRYPGFAAQITRLTR